jgi:hypothetical protein
VRDALLGRFVLRCRGDRRTNADARTGLRRHLRQTEQDWSTRRILRDAARSIQRHQPSTPSADLQFSPAPTAGSVDAGIPVAPLDDAASIFTALQEQLGLKLESTRGPVELMVIDSAERPAED